MTGYSELSTLFYLSPDGSTGGSLKRAGQPTETPDDMLEPISPRLLDLVFIKYAYGDNGFFPLRGLPEKERARGTRSPSIRPDQLQTDLGADTQLAILTVCSAARYKVVEAIRDPSSEPIYLPRTESSLMEYMNLLDAELQPIRYEPRGTRFLSRTASLLNMALKTNNTLQSALLFRLCTSDPKDKVNRYGIFKALFPEIHRKVLSIPIDPKDLMDLSGVLPLSTSTKRALEHLKDAKRTFHLQDVLLTALAFQEKRGQEGEVVPTISIGFLLNEGLTILSRLNPTFASSINLNHKSTDHGLLYELAIFGVRSPQEQIPIYAAVMQQAEKPRIEGKEPDSAQIEALLCSPELLVDPKKFGLAVDDKHTRLIRRHVPIRHLHKEANQPPLEDRETVWERVLFISPETIRNNPEGYYRYQMALIRTIAERLGIPLDKSISVPLPAWVKSEYIETFRRQETAIKALPDDQYLLLYEAVQRLYYEQLPFCAVPPIRLYRKTNVTGKSPHETQLRFAWDVPPKKKQGWVEIDDSFNQLPFLNYFDPREFKLHRQIRQTIPGEFLNELIVKYHGKTLIIHGLARAFFSGRDMDDVSQDDYMAMTIEQARRIPSLDVDIMVLGNDDIGTIAMKTGRRHRDMGVFGGFRRTFTLRTDAAYLSKAQLEKMHNLLNPAQHPSTFCQGMRAWMGRAVDQPTHLLLLGLLPLANIRAFGILPELYEVHGRKVFLAKAIDPLGGLSDYLLSVPVDGERRILTKFFYEDAFPDHHPIAYWQLARTAADLAWQKGVLEWNQMRTVVQRLFTQWPEVAKGLNELQIKDLGMDTRKAITKALHDDPLAIWVLLSGPELRHRGLEGIDLSLFFPSINTLRHTFLKQDPKTTVFDYIFKRLQEETPNDGLTFVAQILWDTPGMKGEIQTEIGGKSAITLDDVKQWITKPLY